MASASSSSVRSRASWAPYCDHGLPCDILTSRTASNPGRRFFRCQVRQHDDYDFFEGVDGLGMPSHCRHNCGQLLRMEKHNYEMQMRLKDQQASLLCEKLHLKRQECEKLEAKLEEALEDLQNYRKWGCVAIAGGLFLILWFLIFGV